MRLAEDRVMKRGLNFTRPDFALGFRISCGRILQTNKGFAGLRQQGGHMKGTQDFLRPVQASALTAILREP